MEPKSPRESEVTMTQMILPSDANPINAAFGGKVMEWIDICGGIAAQRHCRQVVVTASMEVGVTVTAENPLDGMRKLATSALLTFVALSSSGERVKVPPLLLETEKDRIAFQQAQVRRVQRLKRKEQGPLWHRLIPSD